MKPETLETANAIKDQIETLETEIMHMEGYYLPTPYQKTPMYLMRIFRLVGRPTKKTYKKFWCTSELDSIGSAIVLDECEVRALINFKRQKLDELQEQLAAL